jgi:multidrug efflux pump subunit AcrB
LERSREGIVLTNAIVHLGWVESHRKAGMELNAALIEAAKKSDCARF